MDIVIPANNEEEFIEMAEKLGYKSLCFLYGANEYLNLPKKFESKGIKIYTGILADSGNINKIGSKFSNTKVFVAVKSSNNDREVIEKSKADMIFCFEDSVKKDFIHQRASGLNHILCKLANKNNLIIGLSLISILNSKNKHVILGRMIQNIKICKKFKVRTIIASFAENPFDMRSIHDLKSLFAGLGYENPDFLKSI